MTPLTFAVLLSKEKSIEWLLSKSNRILDERDCSLKRAIDQYLEEPVIEGEIKNMEILKYLKTNEKATDERLLEEMVSLIVKKFGSRKILKLVDVNEGVPPKLWVDFDNVVINLQNKINRCKIVDPLVEKKVTGIMVNFDKKGNENYVFTASSSGGSVSAEIYFQYGYWLSKNVEMRDH